VWQAVPYIFADYCKMAPTAWRGSTPRRDADPAVPAAALRARLPYRLFLLSLAVIPLVQVGRPFQDVQKIYAIVGAAFLPLLAVTLLVLGTRRWIGDQLRNRPVAIAILTATLLLTLLSGFGHLFAG